MFAAKNELLTRPSGGFVIPRSLRFRASATAYLDRTVATTGDRQKATWSGWVKRGAIDATARGAFIAVPTASRYPSGGRINPRSGSDCQCR